MIQVSVNVEVNGQFEKERLYVDEIYTDKATLDPTEKDKVVLCFAATSFFVPLLDMSLRYKWELYRNAAKNRIELTINADDIFLVKHIG